MQSSFMGLKEGENQPQELTETDKPVDQKMEKFISDQERGSQFLEPISKLVSRQKNNFFIMIISYFVILVAALVRGGEGKPSILGVRSCSAESWMTLVLCELLCMLIACVAYKINGKILDQQSSHGSNNIEEVAIQSKPNSQKYRGKNQKVALRQLLHWCGRWYSWNWRRNDPWPIYACA